MDNLVKNIVSADKKMKALDGGVRETPLDESRVFGEHTGTTFLLKCEHLQRTGCFKLRGALNRVLALNDEERKNGIVAPSSGNHGIAAAQAAIGGGVEATIYLPDSVSSYKLSNMKRLGAKTVLVPGPFIMEGSAGAAVAAALKSASDYPGKTVAVVICGRNIALDTFPSALDGLD